MNAPLILPVTDVNVSSYNVAATDVMLKDRYTTTGASAVNLPALSGTTNGRLLIVVDSGNNAATNNITVVPAGTNKIGGAAASYVINVSGSAISFNANTVTGNWEII